ncbi:uncharacterized protein TRAVEDRAFT_48154 [Trametes versicolor FP-101664 SS1]|uniref:uncharacterized protein n=1 Tax=Trametes versicolor (strain FP-101664) TaxID=717944 RepID=UPI000462337B|nr:uncharacterized protein TRAVEDRAFT_48154 [Trametes versicolor FP-101664 SS1]EIW59027.1 hypothetical protein TRAVEDRAFT_48154 [Trametes versicolor FP-101664 SS1]
MASSGAGVRADVGGMDPSHRLLLFIGGVAQSLNLSPKYQDELLTFKDFLLDLDPMWWRVLVVQQASTYQMLTAQEEVARRIAELHEDVKSICKKSGSRFEVDKEMTDDVTAVCKILILGGLRENYDLSEEATEQLKNTTAYPRFAEAWTSASKKKALSKVVNAQANYVRKEYREVLVGSVTSPVKMSSLTPCIRHCIKKFGWTGAFTPEMALRVVILRQFVRDNRDVLAPPPPPSPRRSTGPPAKRRRIGGRPEHPFWSEFETWLLAKNEAWGKDIREPQWRAYLTDCLVQERLAWPDDPLSFIPHDALPAALPGTVASFSGLSGDSDLSLMAVTGPINPPAGSPPTTSFVGSPISHQPDLSLSPVDVGRLPAPFAGVSRSSSPFSSGSSRHDGEDYPPDEYHLPAEYRPPTEYPSPAEYQQGSHISSARSMSSAPSTRSMSSTPSTSAAAAAATAAWAGMQPGPSRGVPYPASSVDHLPSASQGSTSVSCRPVPHPRPVRRREASTPHPGTPNHGGQTQRLGQLSMLLNADSEPRNFDFDARPGADAMSGSPASALGSASSGRPYGQDGTPVRSAHSAHSALRPPQSSQSTQPPSMMQGAQGLNGAFRFQSNPSSASLQYR